MKRILSVSVLLMVVSVLCANPVSKETARKIAEAFLNRNNMSQGVKRLPSLTFAQPSTTQEENASLYLFNAEDGEGFVIVSGDDRTEPILGYSDKGKIDVNDMPANMRSWLQHYSDEIAMIQRFDLKTSNEPAKDCGEAIPSALTCVWDQNPVFNDQCPMVTLYSDANCTQQYVYEPEITTDPILSVTGCVATALAQILYYWKQPAATTAEIPAREYVWEDKISKSKAGIPGTSVWIKFNDEAIPAGTTIDWNNMLDDYFIRDEKGYPIDKTGTDKQKAAVANLMHICGAAIGMQYGTIYTSGSQAYEMATLEATRKYLGFPNASFCMQDQYTYQDWLQTLYNEVKVAKAVFFGGQSTSGGHAFVIDGYDKEDNFHVNWGWGGRGNGYYRINSLLPEDQGAGGALVNDGFRIRQMFFRGFYPNAPAIKPELTTEFCAVTEEGTTTVDNGYYIFPNVTVKVSNLNALNAKFEIALRLHGNDYNEYLDLTWGNPVELSIENWYRIPLNGLNIPAHLLHDGVYYLTPYYAAPTDDKWTECRNSENCRIMLTVKGNQVTFKNITPYVLGFVSSNNQDVYKENDEIDFTATLKLKEGKIHQNMYTGFTIRDEQNMESNIIYVARDIYYLKTGDEFDVDFTIPSGLSAGKYSFYFYDGNYRIEVCTVDVKDATEVETVEADTEKKDSPTYNLNGQLVGEDYKGIVIKNGEKFFQNK